MNTSGRDRVYEAIKFFFSQGFSPTVREISDRVGLTVSTVHAHIEHLERDGCIVRSAGRHGRRKFIHLPKPEAA